MGEFPEDIDAEFQRMQQERQQGGVAKIPESFIEKDTIANMKIGEQRYIVPWGMVVDEENGAWLVGKYKTYEKAQGTTQLGVTRADDGFYVDLQDVDYEWDKKDIGNSGIQGTSKEDFIPVKGFLR